MGRRITKSPLWVDGYYTKSLTDGRMTSHLQVDSHYTKSPMGGRITKSPLWVDGYYTKSLTGGRITTVAYEWTVTVPSRLQVDD